MKNFLIKDGNPFGRKSLISSRAFDFFPFPVRPTDFCCPIRTDWPGWNLSNDIQCPFSYFSLTTERQRCQQWTSILFTRNIHPGRNTPRLLSSAFSFWNFLSYIFLKFNQASKIRSVERETDIVPTPSSFFPRAAAQTTGKNPVLKGVLRCKHQSSFIPLIYRMSGDRILPLFLVYADEDGQDRARRFSAWLHIYR